MSTSPSHPKTNRPQPLKSGLLTFPTADETFRPIEKRRRTSYSGHETFEFDTPPPRTPIVITPEALANASLPPPGAFIPANIPFTPTPYSARLKATRSGQHFSGPASEPLALPKSIRWRETITPERFLRSSRSPGSSTSSLMPPFRLPTPDPSPLNVVTLPPDGPSGVAACAEREYTPAEISDSEQNPFDEQAGRALLDCLAAYGGIESFLEHLFDLKCDNPTLQHSATEFYRSGRLSKILDLLWERDGAEGHSVFLTWLRPKAIQLVQELVSAEMDTLSDKAKVRHGSRVEDETGTSKFLLDLSVPDDLRPHIDDVAPVTYGILKNALCSGSGSGSDRASPGNVRARTETVDDMGAYDIAHAIVAQLVKLRPQNDATRGMKLPKP
ncbi:hypothetical protein EVG20_g7245 [Dentipellis fragilis]|uniref:Uncharacterized protein n=1 Tax=Dentipellis fragilis TaxID=205917 RepID=A0A4Y9YGT4_9AGAM|nr:hypothetical protein EVG20_g7245 [Dentipellis fragilis]